jgi:hypothetical protein
MESDDRGSGQAGCGECALACQDPGSRGPACRSPLGCFRRCLPGSDLFSQVRLAAILQRGLRASHALPLCRAFRCRSRASCRWRRSKACSSAIPLVSLAVCRLWWGGGKQSGRSRGAGARSAGQSPRVSVSPTWSCGTRATSSRMAAAGPLRALPQGDSNPRSRPTCWPSRASSGRWSAKGIKNGLTQRDRQGSESLLCALRRQRASARDAGTCRRRYFDALQRVFAATARCSPWWTAMAGR